MTTQQSNDVFQKIKENELKNDSLKDRLQMKSFFHFPDGLRTIVLLIGIGFAVFFVYITEITAFLWFEPFYDIWMPVYIACVLFGFAALFSYFLKEYYNNKIKKYSQIYNQIMSVNNLEQYYILQDKPHNKNIESFVKNVKKIKFWWSKWIYIWYVSALILIIWYFLVYQMFILFKDSQKLSNNIFASCWLTKEEIMDVNKQSLSFKQQALTDCNKKMFNQMLSHYSEKCNFDKIEFYEHETRKNWATFQRTIKALCQEKMNNNSNNLTWKNNRDKINDILKLEYLNQQIKEKNTNIEILEKEIFQFK